MENKKLTALFLSIIMVLTNVVQIAPVAVYALDMTDESLQEQEVHSTEATDSEQGVDQTLESSDESAFDHFEGGIIELPDDVEESTVVESLSESEDIVTLMFDSNGGTLIEPKKLKKGDSLGQLPEATKAGHELIGWYFANGKLAEESFVLEHDVTLYAQWEIVYGPNTDNIDHVMPDNSPYGGEIHYNINPETPFPSDSLFSRSSRLLGTKSRTGSPVIGEDHPTFPGEVMLFKQATPVEGMVNTWDITLRIEGKDNPVTSDIVLVIDTSGSMRDNDRLKQAKAAANSFIDTLLPEGNTTTRIGLVSFEGTATTRVGLTTQSNQLKAAVNALNAGGGTFTQAGVKQAQALLANSDADHKHIVLLSDGEPTYSYQMTNPNDYLSMQYIPGRASHDTFLGPASHIVNGERLATTSLAPESSYTNNRIGSGGHLFHRYDDPSGTDNDKYYNHGNSAIAQAGYAKASSSRVWTIALEVTQTGQDILNEMASPDSYFTADPSDLETVFNNIAGQIGAAVKDAQVSDPMGGGFVVPFGYVDQIVASQGEASYDSNTKTITWNPGTLTTPIESGSDIKYAELKYRIEVNDDILDQTPEGDMYSTNGEANITYIDANGNVQTSPFPVPKVDPILLVVEKVLYDSHGNKVTDDPYDRVFTIEITGELSGVGGAPLYHQIFNLRNGEKRIMTNLRLEDTYTVKETQVKYNGDSGTIGELSDYTTKINVYDIDQSTFRINQTSPDSPVLVTNTEKPLGKITVNKVFQPLSIRMANRLSTRQAPPTFTFTLTKPDGTTEEFSLTAGGSKVFENLPYGEYTVQETDSAGFVASYSDTDATNGDFTDGKVTLAILEKEDSVTVTNSPQDDDYTINVTGKKIWSGGPEADHVAVEMCLKRNGVLLPEADQPDYTVSPATGTANEFVYTWSGLQKYDQNGVPYKYTIDEKTTPEKYEKTVDDETLTVTNKFTPEIISRLEAKKIWANGPTPRPTIYFELFRKVDGGTEEKVPDVLVQELLDGTSSVEWLDLPKEDNDGKLYTYYVKEKLSAAASEYGPPENYELSGECTLTITNTYTPPQQNISAEKVWAGNFPTSGYTHPAVTLQLQYRVTSADSWDVYPIAGELDGTPETPPEGSSGELEEWIFTWMNVNLTDLDGNPYEFRVVETSVPDNHLEEYSGDITERFIVTNTYQTVEVSGTKTWDDANDQDGKRPDTITINLYKKVGVADPVLVESLEVTPDADDNWAWTFTDLPKYEGGVEIVYTVTEDEVEGYTATVEGYDVTNTHKPETVEVSGTKTWSDNDDKKGIRPESITIRLLADGVEVDTKTVTSAEGWAWSFTDLAKYRDGGVEIVYSITEDTVLGYSSSVTGYDVTNTYSPLKLTIEGTKVLTGRKLSSGEFSFAIANASDPEHFISTTTNNADGSFAFEIELNKVGTYKFVVKEVPGSAEHVTYDKTVFTVNVVVSENPEGVLDAEMTLEEEKISFHNCYDPPTLPSTGSEGDRLFLFGGLALIGFGAVTLKRRRRKEY